MKVAEFVALRLQHWGIDTCFTVTGGGAMHLNDSFGSAPGFDVRYMHHEQACAIAAEGYARVAGRPAVLNVTSGPGSINAMNGVFGAFTDSIPMVVVAGQVRRDTNAVLEGRDDLRQLGDQEARILEMVKPITVWHGAVNSVDDVARLVDEAVTAATTGRPGPAWLEIPVDVQGMPVPDHLDPSAPLPRAAATSVDLSDAMNEVATMVAAASRPLVLAGTGVRSAGVQDLVIPLAEELSAPLATAWTHDLIDSDHPAFAGRPGTIGTRAGNFVLQSCDLLLVLGSRLNIRQVSYNWAEFAPHAKIVWIDIDPAELTKNYLRPHLTIPADLADAVPELLQAAKRIRSPERRRWWAWCQDIRVRYEPSEADYQPRPGGINAYHLVAELSKWMTSQHVIACGDATACIVPFQVMKLKAGMRMFSNSGCASMGYDLPAGLGAAVADPVGRVITLAGDGSVMMNLQELQTLRAWAPDVLLLVLDNGGYLSIKQTQRNFFGREFGASPASGVTFPDFAQVARAFDLPVTVLEQGDHWRRELREVVEARGPRVCVVRLDQAQEFEPRLRSRMVDGTIRTPPLDDMYPHLPDDVLEQVRSSAAEI